MPERVVTFSPGLILTDDPTPPEGLSPCLPVEVEQCCEDCEPAEPDVWAAAVEAAWTKLHDLIGDPTLWEWRRCLRVWRPCPEPCGCRSYCDRCTARRVVTVPQFDVRPADVAGLIDGDDINTAAHWTTRRDATSSELTLLGDETLGLPTLQNMDAPTGAPATWGVLLWVGRTPPAVREAVGAIACDILAECAGPSTRPPANATSITEGAVTIRIDPSTPAVQAVRDALAMTTVPAFEFAAPWDTSRGAGRWEAPTQAQIVAVTP